MVITTPYRMNDTNTPYEYHNGKLGVKIGFLISDRNANPSSLKVLKYNALYKRLKSTTCTEKELRRASLGFEALVLFESLPSQWRMELEHAFPKPQAQTCLSYFAKHYEYDREAYNFFLQHRFGDDGAKKLEPEVIERYAYNASVLNTVLKVKANRKAYAKALGGALQLNIWESLSRDVNAFTSVPHDLPTTPTTLRHKVTRYIKEGYACIISGKYGNRNVAVVKDDWQFALIEELLKKHQNLNNEQVADHYNTVMQAMNRPSISPSTIAKYRREFDLFTFAGRRGETNFDHQKTMQVKRSRPSLPMLYWTLDGWDAELLYQRQETNTKGQTITTYTNRLTMVVVLDPYNNYPIGYAIGTNETPALIKEALRNAINHTKELFGERYKPLQLQTDNYQIKKMKELYTLLTKHFTPAKVKNSKAKVIEQYFDKFNSEYFQKRMAINWSGHNINSRKDNQPNADYLNKIRHKFPDEVGCRKQLTEAIEADRAKKVEAYKTHFAQLPKADRMPLPFEEYLRLFGQTTGYTNRLRGDGITPTIAGELYWYDSFDLNFRKYAHLDWCLLYDPEDMSQVLAVNAESHQGKLIKPIDSIAFMLERKHQQPMALYDRTEGDAAQLQRIIKHKEALREQVINRTADNYNTLQELFTHNPQLETLQKLLITDSQGQHKIQKNKARHAELPQRQPQYTDYTEYETIDDTRSLY